jgi:hypothetical protein
LPALGIMLCLVGGWECGAGRPEAGPAPISWEHALR